MKILLKKMETFFLMMKQNYFSFIKQWKFIQLLIIAASGVCNNYLLLFHSHKFINIHTSQLKYSIISAYTKPNKVILFICHTPMFIRIFHL